MERVSTAVGNEPLRNINQTQKEMKDGTYEQKDFYEFKLHERGKTRHIKSMHISDRVVQRSVCDNVFVPGALQVPDL